LGCIVTKLKTQTTYSILQEVLKQEKEEKDKESYINNIEIRYGDDNAILFAFDIKSKSTPGLIHKTIIVIRDDVILMRNCDCKGFRYYKKCWHIQTGLNWINKHSF